VFETRELKMEKSKHDKLLPQRCIQAYQEEKMTVYDIARVLGRSPSAVYNALKEENIDTSRFKHRFKERNAAIVEAYRKNPNIINVGHDFGITKQRVHQILEKEAPEILRRRPRKTQVS
jgi:IS30 family transposase